MESVAASILKRAVDMDQKERYTMALILYQEGLEVLLESIKELKDSEKKKCFRDKATEYMDRAERIKTLIAEKKSTGKYREHMKIESGSIGYGYNSVFGRFLDVTVTQIQIEDPYIRSAHQCYNFLRFCELAVEKCQSLSKITLTTTCDPHDKDNQMKRFEEIKNSLANKLITLDIIFSPTLHDRQIKLSNGWIIKIGRGLDYFRPPEGKFVLGFCSLELRPCLETIVDIFHQSQIQEAKTK